MPGALQTQRVGSRLNVPPKQVFDIVRPLQIEVPDHSVYLILLSRRQ